MRQFSSYGPVDPQQHFCVPRRELVDQCINQLVGEPDKSGHYFTIWAARQTGKTWLIRQVLQEIPKRYGDKFALHLFSIGNLRGLEYNKTHTNENVGDVIIPGALSSILEDKLLNKPQLKVWKDFVALFSRQSGVWDRPVILLIDEVDSAPAVLLDLLVGRFRELYLDRATNWLHGLALVGVRAVLGIESQRGSPFNIQRSLHVPNLTADEVRDMYQQYQTESGQAIEPTVVEKVYQATRGQPGLVSWFGELLTETYNKVKEQPIGAETWEYAWNGARFIEPNNTMMNLIAKAKMVEYQGFLTELFARSNIPFYFHDSLHNYLYMHGILEPEVTRDESGNLVSFCRFTSPFIQECLYDALRRELVNERRDLLALEPLDALEDVFDLPEAGLNLPALLERYKAYLVRLKAKGVNPWKKQPRRQTDFHLTEAVGHFHLYAWLKEAVGRDCVISPEFPTGNGKVDLHLGYGNKRGIIEVKSFVNTRQIKKDRPQAARYATKLDLPDVTLAVFIPVTDETILAELSGVEVVEGVQVSTVMISWV